MSEPTRKVVPFTPRQGHETAAGDIRRKQGESAEIVPVNFRRQTELESLRDTPISFAYVPSEREEGLFEMIINVPEWMMDKLLGVGLNPVKPYEPPRLSV